jgi:hypothetical protein
VEEWRPVATRVDSTLGQFGAAVKRHCKLSRMDYGFRGFFQLRDARDLLAKLRHDHQRMLDDPLNTYPAFDFFVTANHIIDWIWPSDTRAQKGLRRSEPIPRICEHLADGAKHFLLARPHTAVADVHHAEAAFAPDAFSSAFQTEDGLFVTLEPDEAEAIGKKTMTAMALADLVLQYWERRIGRT